MKKPCKIWQGTLTVKGYPQRKEAGKTIRVHREACAKKHGPPPSPEHHAAHRCGARACVEGTHLYWATPLQNNHDRRIHGTAPVGERSGTAKLTAAKVRKIRASRDTQEVLAERYGVAQGTISAAIVRKTWAHIP